MVSGKSLRLRPAPNQRGKICDGRSYARDDRRLIRTTSNAFRPVSALTGAAQADSRNALRGERSAGDGARAGSRRKLRGSTAIEDSLRHGAESLRDVMAVSKGVTIVDRAERQARTRVSSRGTAWKAADHAARKAKQLLSDPKVPAVYLVKRRSVLPKRARGTRRNVYNRDVGCRAVRSPALGMAEAAMAVQASATAGARRIHSRSRQARAGVVTGIGRAASEQSSRLEAGFDGARIDRGGAGDSHAFGFERRGGVGRIEFLSSITRRRRSRLCRCRSNMLADRPHVRCRGRARCGDRYGRRSRRCAAFVPFAAVFEQHDSSKRSGEPARL